MRNQKLYESKRQKHEYDSDDDMVIKYRVSDPLFLKQNPVFCYSDGMAIKWRVDRPANEALLYNRNGPYSHMDQQYANVVAFIEPVIMYIPTVDNFSSIAYDAAYKYDYPQRKMTVQGTVADVLNSIYEEYQKFATIEETQLADANGTEIWIKLIDQMKDVVSFGGWCRSGQNKVALLLN